MSPWKNECCTVLIFKKLNGQFAPGNLVFCDRNQYCFEIAAIGLDKGFKCYKRLRIAPLLFECARVFERCERETHIRQSGTVTISCAQIITCLSVGFGGLMEQCGIGIFEPPGTFPKFGGG